MKRAIKKPILCLVLWTCLFQPAFALRNPAAVYCEELGYEYSIQDSDLGEVGYCQVSATQNVNAWDFLSGKVALDKSYCARQGYEAKRLEDSATCRNCTVCVLQDSTEVEVTDLMELSFTETTCGDGRCGVPETEESCPQDCAVVGEHVDEIEEVDSFVDVPLTHPHAEAIQALKDAGIVNGYDGIHFGPDATLTRAELLKIAIEGAGLDISSYLEDYENPYDDVGEDHSLKQYIFYAYANEIASGYGDGTFRPDQVSSYAEAVKMLLGVSGIEAITPPAGVTYGLPEDSDLGGFVHQAIQLNLLYQPETFIAQNEVPRGYTAEMMYRIREAG